MEVAVFAEPEPGSRNAHVGEAKRNLRTRVREASRFSWENNISDSQVGWIDARARGLPWLA
jgi:hypothetical protein